MAWRRTSGTPESDLRDGGNDDTTFDLSQEIVDEITWYMRQQKVTRADLASSMGVSPGRVSQILSGDENLTLRTLNGVVCALGARLEISLRSVEERTELLDEHDYSAHPKATRGAA